MDAAVVVGVWIIVVLLAAIIVLMRTDRKDSVSVIDAFTGNSARVFERGLIVRSSQVSAVKSDEGKLIAYGAGLIELQQGFNGPVVFFRNDNVDGMNFYLDFIAYSWHPHETSNPLSVVSILYDASEPDGFTFVPSPISMNQNFPNAAQDNGVFALAWRGGNSNGMTGSIGGRGVMVFTLQPEFRMIPFDGKIIINPKGTQRFDVRTDSAGALRLGVVGWFAKTIDF